MSKEKYRNPDNAEAAPKKSGEQSVQFNDNRPETVRQLKQQELADKFSAGKSNPIQKKNNTGMPDNLKQGIEQLSGHSMDDVKVHYNSDKPAQLNAHAYAQGNNIHIASGQEKHLPHEAWHVVQQKQGRVNPTTQVKGANVNDDKGLEKEADAMGAKATQLKADKDRDKSKSKPKKKVKKKATGKTVQKRNINQAGIGKEKIGERNLVADGREVNMYYEKGSRKDNKAKALEEAAKLNAELGKEVTLTRTYREITDDEVWTPHGQKLNNDKGKKIDPFFFGVVVPFVDQGAEKSAEFVFQHAKSFTGYVEAIYDSTNAATSGVPTMYDQQNEMPGGGIQLGSDGHMRNKAYSNRHASTGHQNLLALTAGGTHASFDAYTKIVGEGARWQCVRKHTSGLADSSKFFIKRGTNYRWITFRTLWLSWAATFGKMYNIPDSKVVEHLEANNFRRPPREDERGNQPLPTENGTIQDITVGRDYNLDEGRSANAIDVTVFHELEFMFSKKTSSGAIASALRSLPIVRNITRGNSKNTRWSMEVPDNVDRETVLDLLAGLNVKT